MESRIVYINGHAARYGWYFGRRMPRGYRLAARFWGSGLIDRTETLNTGFPYKVLYPIPQTDTQAGGRGPGMDALCDEMGRALVREAIAANKGVQVLWSGGIDSTAALVGTIKAANEAGCPGRVEVLLSEQSIEEYRAFYQRFVRPLQRRFVSAPVTAHLDPSKLVVTGEHGDQIFGSAKALKFIVDGRAFDPFRDALPGILAETLGGSGAADAVMRYLEPLLEASPVALKTIYDAFWWINFTLKWQIVGLRLAVFRVTDARAAFGALRHYFSHPSFQQWALAHHDMKIKDTLESYKMPLKDYIYRFTGDDEYRRTKLKVPSLKAVFLGDVMNPPPSYRVLMDQAFQPVFWRFDRGRGRGAGIKIPARNTGLS